MVGGGRRKAGRTPAPDKKLPVPQCKSIPIVTWRGACCLQIKKTLRTTHLAATHITTPAQHPNFSHHPQRPPSPPSLIPIFRFSQHGDRTSRRRGRKCYLQSEPPPLIHSQHREVPADRPPPTGQGEAHRCAISQHRRRQRYMRPAPPPPPANDPPLFAPPLLTWRSRC